MNEHHRHQLAYLLHLLDDEDLEQAGLVLTGQYDRRNPEQAYLMINDRRRNPLALTRRLMITLTCCMAVVSTVSLLAVRLTPAALFNIPIFFVHSAVVVLVRARAKITST